jgi:hypothetical protein
MLDFPDSPSGGQTYTSAGVTWSWDTTKWVNGATGVGAGVASFNTRVGAVALTRGDVVAVGGTTTNDSAAAGQIGEYLTAALASGSPVTLTTGTFTTITSLALTAGDWDVDGGGVINCAATMTAGYVALSINPAAAGSFAPLGLIQISNTSMTSFVGPTGTVRVSLAAPATVYLIGFSTFTTAPCTAYGSLRARRVR